MDEQLTPMPAQPETAEVVDIQFRPGQKVYYFDPAEHTLQAGDHVIIDTARGAEFGYCTAGNHTIPMRDVVAPLRPVLRLATGQDEKTAAENLEKEKKAFDEAYLEQFGAVGMDATTVVEPKKFVIETENATIQVDPQRSDLVEMKRIDGKRYVLVAVEGEATVNGVEVNIP